jgi:hypothetical protein
VWIKQFFGNGWEFSRRIVDKKIRYCWDWEIQSNGWEFSRRIVDTKLDINSRSRAATDPAPTTPALTPMLNKDRFIKVA